MTETIATREEWLRAGMELFSEEGMKGLQVGEISGNLGCNTSGFYIYFENKEDFLRQMLHYWRQTKTTRVVENFYREPVEKRLEKLVDMVFADRSLPNFLFHLRNLGKENIEVARMIEEIEEERIVPTRSIFNGLGFGLKEIDFKIGILYSFYLGWMERYKYKKFTPELREQVLEQLHHLLGLKN